MFDDFLEGLSAKWQEFLEWSDEKGLPLRGASDSLEQNGIPPAPFFLGLLIVVVCAIGYFAYSNAGPATGTITINVHDLTGVDVAGANVILTKLSDNSMFFENLSDSDGIAVFVHVPLTAYNVSVSSTNYKGKFATVDITDSPSREQTIKLEEKPVNANATVVVDVSGVSGAVIPAISVKNSLMSVVGSKQGKSVTFSLPKSATYTIIANAEGYVQNSSIVTIGAEDPVPVSIFLYPVADETTVDVIVQLSATAANASFGGAAVKVLTSTGLLLRTLNADADGKSTVKLAKGSKFRFIASLDGYDEAVLDYTADPAFKSVKIALSKPGSDGAVKTVCTVVDEAGNKAGVATVNLYLDDEKVTSAKTAADGLASFSLLPSASYWVTAYKSKYLPTGIALTAGADCKLVLTASTKENAAKVKVKVTDESDGLISGASVALFGTAGALGLPEMTAGSDGAADFSDVPLASVYAYASSKGRTGYSSSKDVTVEGEDNKNYTVLTARLNPQKGTLKFRVIDRFSRQAITGATIDASTTDSGSCTTISGICTVDILEGWGYFKVTAPGYSTYSSAQVQVVPNVEKELQVEMLSSAIAENVKAVFLGLYDLSGNRVSSLEPSTTYNAKFLINAPDMKFTKATLHARIGTAAGDSSTLNAYISGFDGGADASTSGSDSYGVSSVVANTSALDSVESAYDSAASSIEYKWAEFSYPPFAGTKEAYVQVTTRQVKNGTVLFGYRTAYSTANGTLRDPSDDSVKAGQEQLAAVNVTKYSISFGGVCSDDQCLEAKVESSRGEFSKNFEATVPEEFTLRVTSISQKGPYDLRILSNSNKTATIISGSSPSGSATITSEDNGQLAVVSVPSGNVFAEFKVKALRISDALSFAIEVDYEGEKVNGLDLAGRVISSSNNVLEVGVSPSYISALAENAVTFLVKDAYGTPIEDAHIEIGSKTDVFGDSSYETDGSAEENSGADGKYLLEGVYPDAIGSADFTVTVTGYTKFYGSIPVTAKKIVEISPTEKLDLIVDSKEGNSDTISVTNLLENDVRVRSSVVLDKSPRITGTLLSESEFALESGASQEIKFDTWILDSVLDVAKTTRTLSENFTGSIIITARAGSSRQTVKIPFKVYSAFVQHPLEESWGVEEDSAELTVYLGADNTSYADVHVFNSLPTNLLVNYQLDSATDWLSFSPASLVLGPDSGESGQVVLAGEEEAAQESNVKNLTIVANVPSNRKTMCVMENNGQVTTNLTLVASINGIRSERKIPVTLNLQSDVDCVPDNAVDVLMPLGMKVALSAKTLKKENEDGSIAVQEPSKDNTRVVFSGASLSDSKTAPYLTSSSGSTISASPSMAVVIKPQEEFTLALPYVTTYYVDSYLERANNADGSVSFTLNSEDIVTFPAGTTIGVSTASLASKSSTGFASAKFATTESTGTAQAGVTAKVLAYSAVNFKTAGSSAACTSEVKIPKSSTISLPSGTQITTSPSGSKEAALPDCSSVEITSEDDSVITLPSANKIVFSDDTEITRDGQAQSANVPKKDEMAVSYCTQTAKDTYTATFGEDVTFQFSENKTVTSGAIKFGSCQQIVTSTGYTLPPATSISFGETTEVVTDDDGNTAVNVYAGNQVTFASCVCTDAKSGKVRLTSGVTATSGSALSVKPSSIEFVLTDGKLTGSNDSVCVSNSAVQSLNVSATANNIPAGIITKDDIFFGGEYSHSGVLATSKANACSKLTIKANVPDSLLDSYGCIKSDLKQPQVYEGKIKLTAKTLSGVDVSAEHLPEVSVKVTVKKGICEARDMGLSDPYLKGIFVNYDSALTDVKTGQKRVFAFKNSGHTRPLLLVNNLPNDVSVSFKSSDPSVVNCESVPATIKRSDAVSVLCGSGLASGSSTGQQAMLTFNFTYGSEFNVTTVRAIVYSATDASLYSSSPMGDLLPQERKTTKQAATVAKAAGAEGEAASFAETTASPSPSPSPSPTASPTDATVTPATSPVTLVSGVNFGVEYVSDCTTHFCTYDQSVAAYTKFVGNMRQVVDYIAKDDDGLAKRLDAVCNEKTRGTGNEYSKVMLIQVANMNQSFDFLNSVAQSQFGTVTNTAGMPTFDGCGVYKIVAKPQFCVTKFTSASEFKSSLQIDIAAEKVDSCKETLANSMLLLGNDAELIVGNELTKGAGEIGCALEAAAKLDIGALMSGPIKIGVYRNESANVHDDETAAALLAAGFGSTSDSSLFNAGSAYPLLKYDPAGRVKVASSYEDDAYCMREGGLVMSETAAVLTAPSIAMLFSGVGSAPASIDLASTIISTISLTAVEVAGGKSLGCALMCSTLMSSITSKVQMLSVIKEMGIVVGPTGVSQLAKVLGYSGTSKAALLSLGKTHALTAGLTGLGMVGAYTTSGSHTVTALTGTAVQYYSGSASVYNTLFNQKQQYIRYLMQNKLAPNYAVAESRANDLMTNGLTQSTSLAGTSLGAALASSSRFDSAVEKLALGVDEADQLSILQKLKSKMSSSASPALVSEVDSAIYAIQNSPLHPNQVDADWFGNVLKKAKGNELGSTALVETFTEANLKGVNVESILTSKGITASAATTADIIALRADYIPEGITNQLASKTTAARTAALTELARKVEGNLAGKPISDAASIVTYLDDAATNAGDLVKMEGSLKVAYGLLEKNSLGEMAESVASGTTKAGFNLYAGLPSDEITAKLTALNPTGGTLTQKVTSSLNKETAAKYLSQAPVFLATLVAFMMMDCSFEPTQAVLDPNVQNHFVVYSKKKESNAVLGVIPAINQPSMTRVCFADKTTSQYMAEPLTVSKESNCVNIEDSICPAGKSYEACIALANTSNVGGLKSYTLFLSTDEKLSKAGSTELLSSLFNSYSKPWDTKKDPIYRRTSDLTYGWFGEKDSSAFTLINS